MHSSYPFFLTDIPYIFVLSHLSYFNNILYVDIAKHLQVYKVFLNFSHFENLKHATGVFSIVRSSIHAHLSK